MSIFARFKKRFYFIVAKYFRFFANRSLEHWNPRIIAITGSVGKTTMLHLVEAEIGKKAHYSHDANSAYGIAFDILGLKGVTGSKLRWFYLFPAAIIRSFYFKHSEKFYVVEIDGERPHETEFLASWLKPEVTLWISFGLSHAVQFESSIKSGQFESLEDAIAHEFASLPKNTSKRVFIDADNPEMVKNTSDIKAEVTALKQSELKSYSVYPTRTNFVFSDATFYFSEPQPRDLAIQLLMLKSLVEYLKLPLKTDFSNTVFPPGRSSYFEGKNGLRIIDSSYNAHLISVESILDMTRRLKTGHKWLIIGDIVDQGSIEGEEHRKLADLIAEAKPEKIILIGRRTKKYTAPRLKKLGLTVLTTTDPKKALKYIENNTVGDEILIFKGSQYLEWIIEKLLKNPEDAKKLCRREPAARKRREKRGLY